MAKEDEKVTCAECGYPVGTKEDGTKLKVHKVEGVRCDGSDSEVLYDDAQTEGIDKGQSYETLESAQDDEQGPNDSTDPVTPTEPETGTQGVAKSATASFTHTITVRKPCPYLGDQAWHVENGKMVYRLATKAGHVPTTGEAKHTGTTETDRHVLVTYTVPVK